MTCETQQSIWHFPPLSFYLSDKGTSVSSEVSSFLPYFCSSSANSRPPSHQDRPSPLLLTETGISVSRGTPLNVYYLVWTKQNNSVWIGSFHWELEHGQQPPETSLKAKRKLTITVLDLVHDKTDLTDWSLKKTRLYVCVHVCILKGCAVELKWHVSLLLHPCVKMCSRLAAF